MKYLQTYNENLFSKLKSFLNKKKNIEPIIPNIEPEENAATFYYKKHVNDLVTLSQKMDEVEKNLLREKDFYIDILKKSFSSYDDIYEIFYKLFDDYLEEPVSLKKLIISRSNNIFMYTQDYKKNITDYIFSNLDFGGGDISWFLPPNRGNHGPNADLNKLYKDPTLRHYKFNRIYYLLSFENEYTEDMLKNFIEKSRLFNENFKYVPFKFKNGDVNRLLFSRKVRTNKFAFMFTDCDIINRTNRYGLY